MIGRVALIALALVAVVAAAAAQQPATPIDDQEAYEIAAQLRCVVCQNLSVADSPSEMAQQMRAMIRERLATGERPPEVIEYFVDRYGEWILLAPRRRGFNLLVWGFPIAAIAVGLVVTALVIRRWRRRAIESAPATPPSAVDPEMRERIRREMDAEELDGRGAAPAPRDAERS